MNEKNKIELKEIGYTVVENFVDEGWIPKLRVAIDESFQKHKELQQKNNNDIKTDGVALHCIVGSSVFLEFLEHLISKGLFLFLKENYFGSNCIINSFSALDNLPNQPNFSAIVHRDLRFYSQDLPVMVNCLLMVDEFTIENGATFLLPYSHKKEEKPTDEEFFKNAKQITGKSGSILIFDSNVWHSSAPNKTNDQRRAIPITVSRSFMKQLLDYPKAIGYEKMDSFSEETQQLLGYHSRVPASLEEWYQPFEKRFYKKNQD